MSGEFIALDWGTTSFRAYRATGVGEAVETIAAPEGILSVQDGDFEAALERRERDLGRQERTDVEREPVAQHLEGPAFPSGERPRPHRDRGEEQAGPEIQPGP